MNLLALCGWKRWWAERRAHAETKAAYDSLVIDHQRALAELAAECESCRVLEGERDDALLRLDAVQATLYWVEKDLKLG